MDKHVWKVAKVLQMQGQCTWGLRDGVEFHLCHIYNHQNDKEYSNDKATAHYHHTKNTHTHTHTLPSETQKKNVWLAKTDLLTMMLRQRNERLAVFSAASNKRQHFCSRHLFISHQLGFSKPTLPKPVIYRQNGGQTSGHTLPSSGASTYTCIHSRNLNI